MKGKISYSEMKKQLEMMNKVGDKFCQLKRENMEMAPEINSFIEKLNEKERLKNKT